LTPEELEAKRKAEEEELERKRKEKEAELERLRKEKEEKLRDTIIKTTKTIESTQFKRLTQLY